MKLEIQLKKFKRKIKIRSRGGIQTSPEDRTEVMKLIIVLVASKRGKT